MSAPNDPEEAMPRCPLRALLQRQTKEDIVNETDVFILADEALKNVVDQIGDDQWERRVPEDMSARQPGLTLRRIINYHAYDDAWVPEVLAGKTIEEVGAKYDGDL
jgi:hypothetical protein